MTKKEKNGVKKEKNGKTQNTNGINPSKQQRYITNSVSNNLFHIMHLKKKKETQT